MTEQADEDAQEFVTDGTEDGARAFAIGGAPLGEGAQERVVPFGD